LNGQQPEAQAMSEYLFLQGSGHLPRAADAIARRHGAVLVNYIAPGCSCGWRSHNVNRCPENRRHWFAARNRGNPFDQRTEEAVRSDLETANIIGAKKT
jgi:hypothetical protein